MKNEQNEQNEQDELMRQEEFVTRNRIMRSSIPQPSDGEEDEREEIG